MIGAGFGAFDLLGNNISTFFYKNLFYDNLAQVASVITLRIMNKLNILFGNYFLKNVAAAFTPTQKKTLNSSGLLNGRGSTAINLYSYYESSLTIIQNNSFVDNFASQIGKNFFYLF